MSFRQYPRACELVLDAQTISADARVLFTSWSEARVRDLDDVTLDQLHAAAIFAERAGRHAIRWARTIERIRADRLGLR